MPSAEIITIGTELLLGETVDTNTRYIARTLRDAGVDLFRSSTVGDNHERIAQILREGMTRAEIIITTGGLGPTVDDPTREAVALAVGVETEFRPELWEQIQERFQRYGRTPTENNKRQAYVPQGATAIENKVGTAPAFVSEKDNSVIIALPGVPREMEFLMRKKVMPFLRERFDLNEIIKSRLIHTSGVGESAIDARIGDLEELRNPTVGMAAHAGQVDIRITAKAQSEAEADKLIAEVESQLHERLGHWIYGADKETLEGVVLEGLAKIEMRMAAVETKLDGRLLRRLAGKSEAFAGGEINSTPLTEDELMLATKNTCQAHHADVCLGVMLIPGETQQTMHLAVITPDEEKQIKRTYGGPPQMAPLWTVNLSLDFLRKQIIGR